MNYDTEKKMMQSDGLDLEDHASNSTYHNSESEKKTQETQAARQSINSNKSNTSKYKQRRISYDGESNYTDRSSAPLNNKLSSHQVIKKKQDPNQTADQLSKISQQIQLMTMIQNREHQLNLEDDEVIQEDDVGTLNKPQQYQQEEPETESSHLPKEIEFKWVKRFIYIQFAANLLMMVDMGIFPACTIKMQQELNLANGPFGSLGSMVYLGQTIGSVLATFALQKMNAKVILCSCIIINISSLILFTMTTTYWIIALCRVMTGLFQIFFNIYLPVWSDTFGNEKQKSTWLSIFTIASPLGNIVGYMMSAFIQDSIGWRWAFYIQSFALIPAMIGIFIVPGKYMNINKTGKIIKDYQKLRESQGKVKTIASESFLDPKLSIMEGLKKVIQNKNFIRMCGALTVLYFVITGIQFWFSDYLITVMMVPKSLVFTMFGIVSITGPVMGVVVGGCVTTALGGYNSEKSMYVTNILALICLCCSAPIPYIYDTDHYMIIVVLLWFLLFCGGFIVPSMTGMMLNTVQQNLRIAANSVANICYNFFGFLPAPFVYGFIADAGEGNGSNKRHAMRLLMFMPIGCVVFLASAGYSLKQNGFYNQNQTDNEEEKVEEHN